MGSPDEPSLKLATRAFFDSFEKGGETQVNIRAAITAYNNSQLLIKHWAAFCDADPTYPEFADEMERAGLIELVPVTEDALNESFAAERGIEPGGMMWALTAAGRKCFGCRS